MVVARGPRAPRVAGRLPRRPVGRAVPPLHARYRLRDLQPGLVPDRLGAPRSHFDHQRVPLCEEPLRTPDVAAGPPVPGVPLGLRAPAPPGRRPDGDGHGRAPVGLGPAAAVGGGARVDRGRHGRHLRAAVDQPDRLRHGGRGLPLRAAGHVLRRAGRLRPVGGADDEDVGVGGPVSALWRHRWALPRGVGSDRGRGRRRQPHPGTHPVGGRRRLDRHHLGPRRQSRLRRVDGLRLPGRSRRPAQGRAAAWSWWPRGSPLTRAGPGTSPGPGGARCRPT